MRRFRVLITLFSVATFYLGAGAVRADDQLAPGFEFVPPEAKVLLAPLDVELFELSAGGIAEPRADWTALAHEYMDSALVKFGRQAGLKVSRLSEEDADDFTEVLALHAAVARAISLHHGTSGDGPFALPTKHGQLDWGFGDSFAPLREATGADYALFTWMRDSYASSGRKATMVIFAVFGIGIPGGIQVGYATLVDLRTGQVVWFNQMASTHGDLREAEEAVDTVENLLDDFPVPDEEEEDEEEQEQVAKAQ